MSSMTFSVDTSWPISVPRNEKLVAEVITAESTMIAIDANFIFASCLLNIGLLQQYDFQDFQAEVGLFRITRSGYLIVVECVFVHLSR